MGNGPTPSLSGKRLVLGVTGSIAAYKAVGFLRLLIREGATVSVVMTEAATRFITPLTFEVLSKQPVSRDLFEAHEEMRHLTLPQQADAIIIAPATAHMLAKSALGLADDLLSTMLLTSRCPLILAPAMDGDMWTNPTVRAHTETLQRRGAVIVEPEEGPLASGRIGQGRMAEEERILSGRSFQAGPDHGIGRGGGYWCPPAPLTNRSIRSGLFRIGHQGKWGMRSLPPRQ